MQERIDGRTIGDFGVIPYRDQPLNQKSVELAATAKKKLVNGFV
jgi:hypothetical protein